MKKVICSGIALGIYLFASQSLEAIDPPSSPTGVSVNNDVTITWTNPADMDFDHCMVRRSTSGFPANSAAGNLVANNIVGTSQADNDLADGVYYYSIFAFDNIGNPSTAANVTVEVDTVTDTPTLTLPASNTTVSDLRFQYSVPEDITAGSMRIVLSNADDTITLNLNDDADSDFTLAWDDDLSSDSNISSASQESIPDGTYTVTFAYQDDFGNPTATAMSTDVTLERPTDGESTGDTETSGSKSPAGGCAVKPSANSPSKFPIWILGIWMIAAWSVRARRRRVAL